VGDQALPGIREERFYVLTDSDWNHMIEYRMKSVLDGQEPQGDGPGQLSADRVAPPPRMEPPTAPPAPAVLKAYDRKWRWHFLLNNEGD
jgi:hypothetical protein